MVLERPGRSLLPEARKPVATRRVGVDSGSVHLEVVYSNEEKSVNRVTPFRIDVSAEILDVALGPRLMRIRNLGQGDAADQRIGRPGSAESARRGRPRRLQPRSPGPGRPGHLLDSSKAKMKALLAIMRKLLHRIHGTRIHHQDFDGRTFHAAHS